MSPSSNDATGKTTSGVFSQVANEILESVDKLSTHLEEGLSAIFNSDSSAPSPSAGNGKQAPPTFDTQAMKAEAQEFLRDAMPGADGDDIDWNNLDLDAESPLSGIAESVMGDIMQGQTSPHTMRENLDAFRNAITWSEPFIMGLLVFHVFIFLCTCYVARKNVTLAPRIILMVLIAGVVRSAEWINAWAGHHWQEYGITQNYFDPRGIFISIFVCAPLLVNSFIMLLCFLREASQLLVQVKTAELKQKRKKAKSAEMSKPRRGKKDQ